jgi:putative tricarboxylic transport membrane protein
MRRCNQVASVLFFLVATSVLIASRDLVYRVEFSPGAGFFPVWLGIALLVLSLFLLLKNTILKGDMNEANPLPDRQALRRVAIILGAFIVSGLLFERLGFLITMFALVVFLLIYLEEYRWYSGVLISAVMVSAVYGIFKIWLNVPLPLGLFHQ